MPRVPDPEERAAIKQEICDRLSEGEPLRQICRSSKGRIPCWRTVYDWMKDDEDFAAHIAKARKLGYDVIAEECLAIADDATNDYMNKEVTGGAIAYAPAPENVQRSKLRVWARLQLLAKWYPKKYGDKSAMELTGANGGPVSVTDTERAARIAALMEKAKKRKHSEDAIDDLV
jgi:hypothetical protein